MSVWDIEEAINLVLLLVSLGLAVFALVDALTRPGQAYEATGKLSKPAWLLILALCVIAALLFVPTRSILGLISVVASGVYLADVRPALIEITRRR